MPLTPIDVQQKTFGPELRGYNMDEVDDFLDEVVATLKDYDTRLRDAQDRIRALEAELSARGDEESAISRALVVAQKQADAIIAEAQGEADRIRAQAYDETEEFRAARDAERLELNQEIARMRATMADLKRRVSDLAASMAADLDLMEAAAAEAAASLTSPLPAAEEAASPDDASDASTEDTAADDEGMATDGVVDLVDVELAGVEEDTFPDDADATGEEAVVAAVEEGVGERGGRRRPWERDSM